MQQAQCGFVIKLVELLFMVPAPVRPRNCWTSSSQVNPFFGGVFILPQMKVGVEVLNGKNNQIYHKCGIIVSKCKTY